MACTCIIVCGTGMYMPKQVLKYIGCICVVLSLGLALFNVYDTFRAKKSEEDILAAYNLKNDLNPDVLIDPDMDMPEVELDGLSCIGTIEIPSLDIKLPVTSVFTYDLMKLAPCRYSGSVYKENMVIAAHNSWFHFGRIHNLDRGSKVIFTDALGNQFVYHVAVIETLSPESVEEMTSSSYPLTLFTCTLDAKNRVTVRCK